MAEVKEANAFYKHLHVATWTLTAAIFTATVRQLIANGTTDSPSSKYHKTSVNIHFEIVAMSKQHHIPVNTTIILLLNKSIKIQSNGNVL